MPSRNPRAWTAIARGDPDEAHFIERRSDTSMTSDDVGHGTAVPCPDLRRCSGKYSAAEEERQAIPPASASRFAARASPGWGLLVPHGAHRVLADARPRCAPPGGRGCRPSRCALTLQRMPEHPEAQLSAQGAPTWRHPLHHRVQRVSHRSEGAQAVMSSSSSTSGSRTSSVFMSAEVAAGTSRGAGRRSSRPASSSSCSCSSSSGFEAAKAATMR